MKSEIVYLIIFLSSFEFLLSNNFIEIQQNWGSSGYYVHTNNSLNLDIKNISDYYNIKIDSIVLANPRWDLNFEINDLPIEIRTKEDKTIKLTNLRSSHNLNYNLKFYIYYTVVELNVQLVYLFNHYIKFVKNDEIGNITFNKWGAELKRTLRNYVQEQVVLSYKDAREKMFGEIDNYEGQVECIYTGRKIETTGIPDVTKTGFNTEHTWPQAMFADNDTIARSDIFHLYPSDETANNKRANYPFGVVDKIQWQNGGSKLGRNAQGEIVFEPRDESKGNIARSMLYFALRYDNPKQFLNNQESILRFWSKIDTVDQKEERRNHKIYSYQQKYNPFISYGDLLDRIYSLSTDEDFPIIEKPKFSTTYTSFTKEFLTNYNTYKLYLTNAGTNVLEISNIEINKDQFGLVEAIEVTSLPIYLPIDSILTINLRLNDKPEIPNQMTKLNFLINDKNYQLILEEASNNSVNFTKTSTLNKNLFTSFIDLEKVQIYNILGTKILEWEYDYQTNLNLENLNNGVYLVVIQTQKGYFTNKIFINN